MNSEYPHAGKHLNKPIIRDLIPLVYPGEGYFTVNEFRDMIVKYHEEKGGESWIAVEKDAPIRRVLQEFVEQCGWTCLNEKKPYSWGLPKKGSKPPKEGPEPPKDFPVALTLGSGTGSVYLYYYPRDKESANSKRESVWECNIGRTKRSPSKRVREQKEKFDHQSPEIGLEIKTNNPRALEKAIHAILELKGQQVETSGKGSEWFLTSPTEVAGIYTILNSI